jgi:hypothetical protein
MKIKEITSPAAAAAPRPAAYNSQQIVNRDGTHGEYQGGYGASLLKGIAGAVQKGAHTGVGQSAVVSPNEYQPLTRIKNYTDQYRHTMDPNWNVDGIVSQPDSSQRGQTRTPQQQSTTQPQRQSTITLRSGIRTFTYRRVGSTWYDSQNKPVTDQQFIASLNTQGGWSS